jgi:LysM repeat protein
MDTKIGPEAGQDSETQPSVRTAAPASGLSGVQAASSGAGESQLRFFKFLSLALIALLVAGALFYLYRQTRSQPIALLVNGAVVTTVADSASANALIGGLPADEIGAAYGADNKPEVTEAIQFQRVAADSAIDTQATALGKLAAATHLTVLADVISIDGKPVLALPNRDAAQAALDAVRQHYVSLPPDVPAIDTPEFREKVTIERTRTKAAICKTTTDEAARILWASPPAKLYIVQYGETGWSIARKVHMSFSNFIRANSGSDINDLKPGDTVNISQTYPPLTVIVHKTSVFDEPILPGAPQSQAGDRRVTSIDTYVNGVRTGESAPVSIYTVRRATPRRSIY